MNLLRYHYLLILIHFCVTRLDLISAFLELLLIIFGNSTVEATFISENRNRSRVAAAPEIEQFPSKLKLTFTTSAWYFKQKCLMAIT